MKLLRSAAMAFSMFSRLPVPRVEWKNENMEYMLAAFPLVGCALGALLWAWTWLGDMLSFGNALYAAGLTLIPVAFTGGVHLDGFCDTADALASHGDRERKREILKDSHTGAFAVIGVCAYFILYFALCTELTRCIGSSPLYIVPILSRSVSGFAGTVFPTAENGLLHTFSASAQKKTSAALLVCWFVLASAAAVLLAPVAGTAMALAALLCGFGVYRMSVREFGAMSGDLAGYLLQISELVMLFVIVIAGKVGL